MTSNKKKWLIAVFFIIFGVIHTSGVYAAPLSSLRIDIIKQIESSGNARAHNKKEDARGLYQIRKAALTEWNQYHPTEKYTMNDLWKAEVNEKIAIWYLTKRIPQILKAKKKEINIRNIIIAYNAGHTWVGKANLPIYTQKYFVKYQKRGGVL